MKAFIYEEHASVLALWWEMRAPASTLVSLDAHLDLQHISAERIAWLEGCQSVEQVRALQKEHFLLPDGRFGYGLENFLYPASRLGLIERLIWVAPQHVRTAPLVHAIRQLQQMDGVRPEDLYGFRTTGEGWLEGRILGLDVVVCDYRHLEHMALPANSLIDIDIDYFIAGPGDTVWIDPREVFEVINGLSLAPRFVTLSRSVDSGFTPLRFRFIADYLAALWEDRRDEQAHYARLFENEARLRAGGREAATAELRRELEHYPGCAATWHLLGLAEGDDAAAAKYRERAGDLSRAYRQNVLRSACELRNCTRPADLSSALGLERSLALEAGPATTERGLAWAALGLIYCALGELPRAMDCYRRTSSALGEHPELALEIGKLLAGSGRPDQAETYLRVALLDDKSRTVARFFIAQTQIAKGHLVEAREHLMRAVEAALAWDEPIDLLAQVHSRSGDHGEARACRMRCDSQRMQTERLLCKLGQDHLEKTG